MCQSALETDLGGLLQENAGVKQWDWVLARVSTLWPHWLKGAQELAKTRTLPTGRRLRVR